MGACRYERRPKLAEIDVVKEDNQTEEHVGPPLQVPLQLPTPGLFGEERERGRVGDT